MLLTIDIGNTTLSMGIFKGNKLVWQGKILTARPANSAYYLSKFKKMLKNKKIDSVIIASVVPQVTGILKAIFNKYFGIKPIILGEDLIVPIKNLYKNPKQVGQDRLVNAYAAYKKYGGGLIVIDFGTAVTFDVVSKKGGYLGGIIFPGIETSLKTLSEKAALLPHIKIKGVKTLIGKDTRSSMLSGVLHGYGALCDGLVNKIKNEIGKKYKVILTGGHAKLIAKSCSFNSIQPDLTLEGLALLHKLTVPGS
jgi:type III pantothenate kinase